MKVTGWRWVRPASGITPACRRRGHNRGSLLISVLDALSVGAALDLLDLAKEEKRRQQAGEPPLPPPPPRPRSFARKTRQHRRLYLAQAVLIVGGLAIMGGCRAMNETYGATLTLIGTLVGAIGFIAMCMAVRCPRCRAAVVWHTFNTQSAAEAQDAAIFQTSCPKCGYNPE